MKTFILYDRGSNNDPDSQDSYEQALLVHESLKRQNIESFLAWFDFREYEYIVKMLEGCNVFNLVDNDVNNNLFHVPLLLEALKVPYTGCPSISLSLSSNKPIAKQIMRDAGILTPWFCELSKFKDSKYIPSSINKFIIKHSYRHASQGITQKSVVDKTFDIDVLSEDQKNNARDWFVEEYIDGSEFNVGMIQKGNEVFVLPIAEMKFKNWPKDKYKIMDYDLKWNSESDTFNNAVRDFNSTQQSMIETLTEISVKCWNTFHLRGYARVDFRLSSANVPYVLEVNANPCIGKDSGFVASAEMAGLSFDDITSYIMESYENCNCPDFSYLPKTK
jgi:D-alanine-D-alanine ligase